MRTLLICFAIVAVFSGLVWYWFFRELTPDQKLARFMKEEGDKGKFFSTTIDGRPMHFYLKSCKVYLLDLNGDKVKQEKVLEPSFYPWFTVCAEQEMHVEGEYLRVYLRDVAIGAGGGNTGGGEYRSKDGRKWEKHTGKGWRPVEEVQH